MKIAYEMKRLSRIKRDMIALAENVINEYALRGFDLTLRQLYYQFVAHDLFPDEWIDQTTGSKNSQQNYRKLMSVVNDGRMCGLLDWDTIVDRTRNVRSPLS